MTKNTHCLKITIHCDSCFDEPELELIITKSPPYKYHCPECGELSFDDELYPMYKEEELPHSEAEDTRREIASPPCCRSCLFMDEESGFILCNRTDTPTMVSYGYFCSEHEMRI